MEEFSSSHPELYEKYSITVRELESEQMPYNSDHAPFVYEVHQEEGEFGKAMLCYGSGSLEYHTYLDNMDRFNEESLAVSGIIIPPAVFSSLSSRLTTTLSCSGLNFITNLLFKLDNSINGMNLVSTHNV